ncbi:hypothetical protein RND81_02G004800 [Saponaria officinalis]|uniref:FAD-binding PCMH-type domain-containing protein n=1 Tax=Saponaria officinalis TaxID=3572 RepID=A0AAW1MJP2_SAPOF
MNDLKRFILTRTILFYLVLVIIPRQIVSTKFLQCMTAKYFTTNVHARDSSIYTDLLQKAQHNPRWLNAPYANRPLYIVTPTKETEITATILCSKQQGLQVRIRSGGHDYEGLSYLSRTPFVLIDLIKLREINIDMRDQTVWVQTGTTLGELYYKISKTSNVYGFPAGTCPTVGVGGHISGGGFGALTRKYGVAADHVVDARLVDVNGRVLNRVSMGEDLFWAIRGGGGASFGVITAWKIKLVPVPNVVTVFTVHKTLAEGASKLVDRWQRILHKLPDDLFIRIIVQNLGGGNGRNKIVQVSFNSMFLGNIRSLMPLMKQSFPELGLKANDCTEMSWIDSVLYFAGYSRGEPREVLLDRAHQLYKTYFKAKSDFVTRPIPETALQHAWERHLRVDTPFMILEPLGGKMDSIPETQIPFPHRKGNLYNIQYMVKWKVNEAAEAKKHVRWIRLLHKYMGPYVSVSPRAAYLNYRDLDLGINGINGTKSYSDAKVWGIRYFKNNFERLAKVKSRTDPTNFFRDEQSIPPFSQVKIAEEALDG